MSDLLAAVYSGDQARIDELLAGDPELDVFEAAALGRVDRLEALLDGDPGLVSAWAEDGFTPLHLSAFFRHPEAARLLVERGALVDVVARNEELQVTPLQSAAASREEESAALLLERGADPNVQQRGGFTALHAAARNGDEPLAELLLAHGADRAIAADDGRTAADFARDAGHENLAKSAAVRPSSSRRASRLTLGARALHPLPSVASASARVARRSCRVCGSVCREARG